MDKQQWQAFIDDKPAREAAKAKWLEQQAKLVEAERLLFDEKWTTDDPWPGVIYRGPTGDGIKVVDVETWTLMRALVRGMGEAMQSQDREWFGKLEAADAEVARLKADNQRMRDALQWCGGEADAIARNVTAQRTQAMLASMQVLALDGGKRARDAGA